MSLHVISEFLKPHECLRLIEYFERHNPIESVTVDGTTPTRKSKSVYMINDDAVLNPVWRRIPSIFIQKNCERAQITKYDVNGEYKLHSDAFDPETLKKQSKQRDGTFLIYLNDVAKGGETDFPRLGKRIRPRMGTALWFRPSKNGQIDEALLHAALPLKEGVKYIVQIWSRGNDGEKK